MIQLKNVNFHGVSMGADTSTTLNEMQMHKDNGLVIHPQGIDSFKLLGALQALRSQKELHELKITVKGTKEDEPWESYTLEGYIHEYGMETQANFRQGVNVIRMRIVNAFGEVDESKLPKIKMEITNEDARYLQSLITYYDGAPSLVSEDKEKRTRILQALKAVMEEDNK